MHTLSNFEINRGIRGYTVNIYPCPNCGQPTNVKWEGGHTSPVVACSLECAQEAVLHSTHVVNRFIRR